MLLNSSLSGPVIKKIFRFLGIDSASNKSFGPSKEPPIPKINTF
jgi:ribosomal protein S5